MKPAEKTPGLEPWRTNSLADGTALGIVPGFTERPTLEVVAAVFDRSSRRQVASPDMHNYFGDPLRSSGMVRAVSEAERDRDEALADIGGRIEIDHSGRVKQD